jgi:hypothetical protein
MTTSYPTVAAGHPTPIVPTKEWSQLPAAVYHPRNSSNTHSATFTSNMHTSYTNSPSKRGTYQQNSNSLHSNTLISNAHTSIRDITVPQYRRIRFIQRKRVLLIRPGWAGKGEADCEGHCTTYSMAAGGTLWSSMATPTTYLLIINVDVVMPRC